MKPRRTQYLRLSLAFVLTVAVAAAETRRFEVAAIRPVGTPPPNASVALGGNDGGRFVAHGVTPQVLVQLAYRVQRYQITGAPAWFSGEAFDIEAKPPRPSHPRPMRARK